MESGGPYTLETTEGDRPLVISNAQGGEVFTFEARDWRHAEETLENLNAPPALLGDASFMSESLEDTDELVAAG